MTKQILIDKLSYIVIVVFFSYVIMVIRTDWQFSFILSACFFIFFGAIYLLKTDLYIQNYSYNNGVFKFEYQRNFSVNKVQTFSINSESIKSYKFGSKPFKNSFNFIYIKYIDHDGDIDDKTFKMSNDDEFIAILSELKKGKTT